ncbi:MAG TPA: hypothetical protein VIK53_19615 [Verrucomicrobiae bacterium]
MKKLNSIYLMLLFVFAITIKAQTQTVTLTATNGLPSSFNCASNQIITINSFIGDDNLGSYQSSALISFNNGNCLSISPYHYGINSGSTSVSGSGTGVAVAGNAFFTGVTNISVSSYGGVSALTFTITTPSVQSSIPANAVVIPTDATGPVQIVLESSSDLVNWTSSLPGTYGSTYTNRFFRVRAIAQ